ATPGGAAFQVVAGRLAQHKRLQRLGDDGYQAYLRKFVRLLAHGLRLWSGDRALDRRAGIDADGRLAPLRAISEWALRRPARRAPLRPGSDTNLHHRVTAFALARYVRTRVRTRLS